MNFYFQNENEIFMTSRRQSNKKDATSTLAGTKLAKNTAREVQDAEEMPLLCSDNGGFVMRFVIWNRNL